MHKTKCQKTTTLLPEGRKRLEEDYPRGEGGGGGKGGGVEKNRQVQRAAGRSVAQACPEVLRSDLKPGGVAHN